MKRKECMSKSRKLILTFFPIIFRCLFFCLGNGPYPFDSEWEQTDKILKTRLDFISISQIISGFLFFARILTEFQEITKNRFKRQLEIKGYHCMCIRIYISAFTTWFWQYRLETKAYIVHDIYKMLSECFSMAMIIFQNSVETLKWTYCFLVTKCCVKAQAIPWINHITVLAISVFL